MTLRCHQWVRLQKFLGRHLDRFSASITRAKVLSREAGCLGGTKTEKGLPGFSPPRLLSPSCGKESWRRESLPPPHFTFPAGRLLTSCFILSLNLPICKVGVLLPLPAVREKCEKMREGPNARQSYPLVVCDLLLSAFSQDVRDSQTSPGRDEGPGWQGGGSVDQDEQEDLPMC